MNFTKIFVTILATIIYTSAIWCITLFDISTSLVGGISILIVVIGGFAIFIGASFLIIKNWNN